MNRELYLKYIINKLNIFEMDVKTRSKINLQDINIVSEMFFCELINMLYNFKLTSTNKINANYEGIDLIDKDNKIIMQVTSNTRKDKINTTLSKQNMQKFKNENYNLKFLIISSNCANLKKNSYDNIFNINFDPKKDIIDLETIIKEINSTDIDSLINIYDFFMKNFKSQDYSEKKKTNITEILNILSQKDLSNVENKINLDEYNIDEKINFNQLKEIKDFTIDTNKIYIGLMEKIYREFDEQGMNKTLSVFNKLSSFYEEELIRKDVNDNIEIFFNIINKTMDYIKNSENYISIPEEELEQCVRIIIVDAFVRCKIFKNPKEGYSYVTSD